MSKRIYIAGPMSSIPDHNFPAFKAAAKKYRGLGWIVYDPSEGFGGDVSLAREEYMRVDILHLTQCHAVAFLDGWTESRGALVEFILGYELGLDFIFAETGAPITMPLHQAVELLDHLLKGR